MYIYKYINRYKYIYMCVGIVSTSPCRSPPERPASDITWGEVRFTLGYLYAYK